MSNLREIGKKINIKGNLLFEEPMSFHTTFKTGGRADILAFPESVDDLNILLHAAKEEGIPVTVTGGGANILVSDSGIRGIVINTSGLNGFSITDRVFTGFSGMDMSKASWETGSAGLAGLETFYAMPGTLGGAVWMNARCYGRSISETLKNITLLHLNGELEEYTINRDEFAYKKSPFQEMDSIILKAQFLLDYSDSRELIEKMKGCEDDRRNKGHFRAPSAGSVFKNNRDFGKPSGQIVDEAGLKGYKIGGAMVSPEHGNIIFNTGKASSQEIRRLINHIKKEVFQKTGFRLEEEVIYTGEWD